MLVQVSMMLHLGGPVDVIFMIRTEILALTGQVHTFSSRKNIASKCWPGKISIYIV